MDKRSGGQEQTREFSAALVKARSDALASRARAFALQQRLDQADVSGLQVRPARVAFFPTILSLIKNDARCLACQIKRRTGD